MGMTILQLPARLTRDEVRAWTSTIQSQLKSAKSDGGAVTIDASALKQFDSSALAALLAVRREAQKQGIGYAGITGVSATFRSLADVYGVEELFVADQGAAAST